MTLLAMLALAGLPGLASANTGVCTNDNSPSSDDYVCVGVSTFECTGTGLRAGASIWFLSEDFPPQTYCLAYAVIENPEGDMTVTGVCVHDPAVTYDPLVRCAGVITWNGFRCVGTWTWEYETGTFNPSCIV